MIETHKSRASSKSGKIVLCRLSTASGNDGEGCEVKVTLPAGVTHMVLSCRDQIALIHPGY